MPTPVSNFAKVTVSTGYDDVATSIVLSSGHGSRLPSTFPYPLVWWNATDFPDPSDDPNREIVTVTNRSADTLTVTRAAEGTSASTKNTASKTYKMLLTLTKAMWEELSVQALRQSFRGLHVRTHVDSDKEAAQATLVHADALVMDDGEEVSDWNNLSASLAVSGAGGLDTGTEQADTLYQLYAIRQRASDTRAVMFHRAKDVFPVVQITGGEDGQHALRDATARTMLGQGFQTSTAGPCVVVAAKLARVGSPSGHYWATLRSDSSGVPSATVLATTRKHQASRLPTSSVWVFFVFLLPSSISTSTQYHMVLEGDFTINATDYIVWRADTTAASYSGGSKSAFDGATWTADTDDDFMFRVFVTRNEAAVVMPSGYDQKALIGYFPNDASSNLYRQEARGNRIAFHPPIQLVNETTTGLTFAELNGLAPADASLVRIGATGTGAAGNTLALSGLDDVDLAAAGAPFLGQAQVRADLSNESVQDDALVTLDQTFFLYDSNQSGADIYVMGIEW